MKGSLPKGVISQREEFATMRANSSLYEMTPISMGGNNENDRVTSAEGVPIHLNAGKVLLQVAGETNTDN